MFSILGNFWPQNSPKLKRFKNPNKYFCLYSWTLIPYKFSRKLKQMHGLLRNWDFLWQVDGKSFRSHFWNTNVVENLAFIYVWTFHSLKKIIIRLSQLKALYRYFSLKITFCDGWTEIYPKMWITPEVRANDACILKPMIVLGLVAPSDVKNV